MTSHVSLSVVHQFGQEFWVAFVINSKAYLRPPTGSQVLISKTIDDTKVTKLKDGRIKLTGTVAVQMVTDAEFGLCKITPLDSESFKPGTLASTKLVEALDGIVKTLSASLMRIEEGGELARLLGEVVEAYASTETQAAWAYWKQFRARLKINWKLIQTELAAMKISPDSIPADSEQED